VEAMAARMASIGAARPYKQNFSDVKAGVKLTTKSRLPPCHFTGTGTYWYRLCVPAPPVSFYRYR
jgi:hypothetical protein